ncbi:NADPH-dependent FMN reductase [Reichenbachiella versicolor]|uniref:NADPH-dependent FMN reductase n=1 Tax=Reichenbachiella versicolor TaxID=1821036 RepID=UPI000D6DD8B1|nr:NAD(P)H-dependent oxidoreductase [Reichenbachiella versicolor]
MKKVLAFGASNSKKSINQRLAVWAANQLNEVEVITLDLNDFEMPIFSIDKELEQGIPKLVHDFKAIIREVDGLVISFAEHNGSFSAAYKNVTDWASRVEKSMWLDKPVFLMATSPGPRGGMSVLEHAKSIFPFRGATVTSSYSLPSFEKNFNNEITNPEEKEKFKTAFENFKKELKN